MVIEHTKTVAHGRRRTLGIRTWLGAGALTVGVGAALVGAAAVAQADTGNHPSAGSPSSSSSKHEAGPKRIAGVASTKRVSASSVNANGDAMKAAAAVSSPSAQAKVKAAAATPRANASQTDTQTQTIDTPLGPVTVAITTTAPNVGESGPVGLQANVTTPLGAGQVSLGGDSTFTATPSPNPSISEKISINQGTLALPGPVAFLINAAGSAVLGGLSAADSFTTFATSLQSGNVLGAVQAFLEGAPRMTNAVMFGQRTLSLPIPIGDQTVDPALLNIPFGGWFAPLQPVTLTWPGLSYVDSSTGADVNVTIDPINVAFEGTKFGGVVAGFGQLIGLL